MAINNISTAVRNAMCDAFVDAIDTGSTNPGGRILLYDAGFTNLIATLQFSAPAFGNSASGVATASAITDGTAVFTATATLLRVTDRDNTTVFEGTVGVSGADLNLSSNVITSGDTISCTAATITAAG